MLEKFHIAYGRLLALDTEAILDTDGQPMQRSNGFTFVL
jgi:hypothetical protein